VRRSFRVITNAVGLGREWTPRELRHTFVSPRSANNVSLEDIARLVGHSGTKVTERVYRHEIRPSLTQGAEVMDHPFQ
jgi:integrase